MKKKSSEKNNQHIIYGKILMLWADEVLAHLKLIVNDLCLNFFW